MALMCSITALGVSPLGLPLPFTSLVFLLPPLATCWKWKQTYLISVNLPIIATWKVDPIIANAELLKCGGRRRHWSMLNRKSKAGATFFPLNQVHSYNV